MRSLMILLVALGFLAGASVPLTPVAAKDRGGADAKDGGRDNGNRGGNSGSKSEAAKGSTSDPELFGTTKSGTAKSKSGTTKKTTTVSSTAKQSGTLKSGSKLSKSSKTTVANYMTSIGITTVKAVPPGIAKNLARGKPMPPGIVQTRVPASITSTLSLVPGEVYVVGADLIVVDPATGTIKATYPGAFDPTTSIVSDPTTSEPTSVSSSGGTTTSASTTP